MHDHRFSFLNQCARWTVMILFVAPSIHAESVSTGASSQLLAAPPGDHAGGGRVSSGGGAVVLDMSVGHPVAGNVAAAGDTQIIGNWVGQLYDVTSLAVSTAPGGVDERDTRQMQAEATLDDSTRLMVDPGDVLWSESSPALAGVDEDGLVTAGTVFEDTEANLTGSYQSIHDADGFDLTVFNVTPDDFGTYAGDGIDDDWQVGYFGLPPNPLAGPTANSDVDRDNNLAEFLGGFDPTDPDSYLQFQLMQVSNATTTFRLNRAIPNRIYRLMETSDLASPFSEVLRFSVDTEEDGRTLQDPEAPEDANFYQLRIERP